MSGESSPALTSSAASANASSSADEPGGGRQPPPTETRAALSATSSRMPASHESRDQESSRNQRAGAEGRLISVRRVLLWLLASLAVIVAAVLVGGFVLYTSADTS